MGRKPALHEIVAMASKAQPLSKPRVKMHRVRHTPKSREKTNSIPLEHLRSGGEGGARRRPCISRPVLLNRHHTLKKIVLRAQQRSVTYSGRRHLTFRKRPYHRSCPSQYLILKAGQPSRTDRGASHHPPPCYKKAGGGGGAENQTGTSKRNCQARTTSDKSLFFL